MRISTLVSAFSLSLAAILAPASAISASSCLLVADATTGNVIKREGDCAVRNSPMSTFKLPLALMGFDAGILTAPDAPRLDYRPEYNASKREQKAVDPTIWLHESMVWYSQVLTRELGMARFQRYVDGFGYGNRDLRGGPGEDRQGLTHAWLMSSLEISPDEQAAFVRKIVLRQLPISARAYELTAQSVSKFRAGDWTVYGKTGSGWLRNAKGEIDRNRPLGWFVGWAEKDGRSVVFARRRVLDAASDTPASITTRDMLLRELPELMEGK